MFPEGAMFILGVNEVIKVFPEEPSNDFFRSAGNRPKIENSGAGIDRVVMLFDEKTYKSTNKLFMRE